MAAAKKPTTNDTMEVRNPITISADDANPRRSRTGDDSGPCPFIRMRENDAATEARRSNKAIPGAPCGNIENKRCMA